jgi:acetate kinase
MKKIMVINLGSTSFKFKLFEIDKNERLLASGSVEIGKRGKSGISANNIDWEADCNCLSHADAMDYCIRRIIEAGIIADLGMVDAVCYKAVHGGAISGARIIDEELLAEMERMVAFAPAHNPAYLSIMRHIRQKYPLLTQVAHFETSFHLTQPLYRAVYGVPFEWHKEFRIRRYGFHGASHSFIAWKMSQEAPELKRIISCHLGGSSSLCAIKNGKSIANSMGSTPQSGLFHNNRVGDFDVFCLPTLAEKMGGIDSVMRVLSRESGFKGLSGVSNDLRDVIVAADSGNNQAKLAIDAFCDNIVGYIGMFTAYLGGLDAIVFTGGIGFNSIRIRSSVCDKLSFINVKLNSEKNIAGNEGCISAADSGVPVWIFKTDEELMVARGCINCLNEKSLSQ